MKVTVPNVLGSPLTYEKNVTSLGFEYDQKEDADSELSGNFGYAEVGHGTICVDEPLNRNDK